MPLATALTHFEYLLGEFGMSGENDFATLSPDPRSQERDPISAASQRESAPPLQSVLPVHAPSPSRTFNWSELLLRIDAIVEPYTRAIVLLILVAVGAFTMLLFRSSDDSSIPQSAPVSATARPLPDAVAVTPTPKKVRREPTLSTVNETETSTTETKPTASGPVGLPKEGGPPLATLSTEIQPVPSDLEDASSEFPSTGLSPPSSTRSARLTEGGDSAPSRR